MSHHLHTQSLLVPQRNLEATENVLLENRLSAENTKKELEVVFSETLVSKNTRQ